MTKQEKETVEDLKEEIKGAEYEGRGKNRIILELKTVLNLIQKQQEEIEKNMNFINYLQLQDVEKLGQIIKKDKIIELMAKKIHILDDGYIKYCNNRCIHYFFDKMGGTYDKRAIN